MSIVHTLASKKVYAEDISVLAAGQEIIGVPCVVYSISVCNEALNQNTVTNISDSASAYDNSERCLKLITTPYIMTNVTFPNGLPLKNGLSATCNAAGTDIMVSYE